MKKFKVLFSSFLYIFILLLVNFLSVVLFSLLFMFLNKISFKDFSNYTNQLSIFINDYDLFIVILSFIILLPFLYKRLKKTSVTFSLTHNFNPVTFSFIGIFSSLFLNVILSFIGVCDISFVNINVSFLLSTCLLGPILEELVFRGIIYKKISSCFSSLASIILTSLLFGIYHINLTQLVYTFLISLIITSFYKKTDNLAVPIVIHIFANLASTLFLPYIFLLPVYLIIILCLIVLFFGYLFLKNKAV